jgi:TadE-like protein
VVRAVHASASAAQDGKVACKVGPVRSGPERWTRGGSTAVEASDLSQRPALAKLPASRYVGPGTWVGAPGPVEDPPSGREHSKALRRDPSAAHAVVLEDRRRRSRVRQTRASRRPTSTASVRGQSLVEFALVLPLLLILLLGVADFGRVFAAGITMEATTRNAAEAAAQEYQQIVRNKGALDADDYQHLHRVAVDEVCKEARVLPNRAVDGSGLCTMPITAVCVHDAASADPQCGTAAVAVPATCSAIDTWASSADPANLGPVTDGVSPLPYVEVRTCYLFTTLFNLHLSLPLGAGISVGDIWLQRDRQFAVGDY